MKHATVLWALIFVSHYLFAQQHALAKQWDRRFGGPGDDESNFCSQTMDNGYLIVGSSYSRIGGDMLQDNWDTTCNTDDCWVVKLDSLGNKVWEKRFGGTSDDRMKKFVQTYDGGVSACWYFCFWCKW